EAVFETRRRRPHFGAGENFLAAERRAGAARFGAYETHLAAGRDGVDDIRAVEQARLKLARLSSRGRIGEKGAPGGEPADVLGAAGRQRFAAVHDDHLIAA